MSATHKAWYWLAAGVLALGLNGYYQDGGFQELHQLAACTRGAVNEARAQFREVATLAEVTLAERARSRSPRLAPSPVAVDGQDLPVQAQVRLAKLQTRLSAREAVRMARQQRIMAEHDMRRAQVEIENGRLAVFTNSARVNIALPPMPRVEVATPDVAVVAVPGESN